MKRIIWIFIFLIQLPILVANENYQTNLRNKMEKEQIEYSKLLSSDNTLVLCYKETFFETNRIITETIYCNKNNMHCYISENEKIIMEILINNDMIWEIKDNKKKSITKLQAPNNFFCFWWTIVNPEDLIDFSEINDLYFCENKEHNYKLIFDKEYELKQIEIIVNGITIRYKILNSLCIEDLEIRLSSDAIVYQDSIAIKETVLTNYYFSTVTEEFFQDARYKKYTFIDSIIDCIKDLRKKR